MAVTRCVKSTHGNIPRRLHASNARDMHQTSWFKDAGVCGCGGLCGGAKLVRGLQRSNIVDECAKDHDFAKACDPKDAKPAQTRRHLLRFAANQLALAPPSRRFLRQPRRFDGSRPRPRTRVDQGARRRTAGTHVLAALSSAPGTARSCAARCGAPPLALTTTVTQGRSPPLQVKPAATVRSPVGSTAPHRGTAGATEPRPARYHVCGHGHPRIGFQMSRSLMLAPPCSASRVPIIIIAAHLLTRCGNLACWKPGFTHPRMLHTRVYHTCMPQAVLVSLPLSKRWVRSSAIVTRRRGGSGYILVLVAHVALASVSHTSSRRSNAATASTAP